MKRRMKVISMVLVLVLLLTSFVGCSNKIKDTTTEANKQENTTNNESTPTEAKSEKESKVQGVTDKEIVVGNTAAVSGAFAFVGVPFNDAIKAVIKQVNEAGGIGGRTIKFITYDDGFNAATGMSLTEKLVEEDKIFALVGHFGTPTVSATLDYIQEYGVPMVYAATGINALYFEESKGNPVMAVQPIYKTDGRIMTARVFHEALFGENSDQKLANDAKVGVLYVNDDAGNGILEGVKAQAEKDGRTSNLVIEAVTEGTYSTAVQKLKDQGVSVIILAMNQAPFKESLVALSDAQLEVPVFTSYNNSDPTAIDHTKYSEKRPIYTNAWVDVLSEKGKADVQGFVTAISQADLTDELKNSYYTNAFATAGYIAAIVFVEGLKRIDAQGLDLNWDNYIKVMEDGPIDIPMGGTVDFTNGKRWGIDSMSLLKYKFTETNGEVVEAFDAIRPIETLTDIESK